MYAADVGAASACGFKFGLILDDYASKGLRQMRNFRPYDFADAFDDLRNDLDVATYVIRGLMIQQVSDHQLAMSLHRRPRPKRATEAIRVHVRSMHQSVQR